MSVEHELNHDEKVFLAGAVKHMIAVDGKITNEELTKIPGLFPSIAFDDFDACLKEFELKVKSMDALWVLAKGIVLESSRNFILQCLYDVSLMDGMSDKTEMGFLQKLSLVWEKKELI
jgi:hypothetical protein